MKLFVSWSKGKLFAIAKYIHFSGFILCLTTYLDS